MKRPAERMAEEAIGVLLLGIAKQHLLDFHGFKPRGRDSLDFHELYCTTIEQLMRAAFEAGRRMGSAEV